MKVIYCLLLLFCCLSGDAWSQTQAPIPGELAPWQDWVLHDKEQLLCPSLYDNADAHQCRWPETLELEVGSEGGAFKQSWTVLAPTWLPLPGDEGDWPQNVTLNNEPAPAVLHDGSPAIFVRRGRYAVAGEFKWKQVPQTFQTPPLSGLLSLKVNGEKIGAPFVDANNRIWIQKHQKPPAEDRKSNNKIQIQIFRLLEDKTPFTIHTRIRLIVSGERRREKIASLLLADSLPVRLSSPLPAALSGNRDVWVEVKPGQWDIHVLAVVNAVVTDIGPIEAPYGNEIWVFKPFPHLRMTSMEGLKPIDPAQTTLPPEWQQYAAFLATKGDRAHIQESQRGISKTAPDSLRLHREMWLDFDGGAATVRDRISGKIGLRKFVGMDPKAYTLGRLMRGGNDQLVTYFGKDQTGIEMEKGPVEFSAVSRLEKLVSGHPFQLGWNCEFQEAEGALHLPLGWTLLGVRGGILPDGATWITQWTLLDFFIILIIAMGVGKLRSWRWGIVFWIGLLLTWQEHYAPGYIWLVPIVTTALLKRLTDTSTPASSHSWITSVKFWHMTALLFLSANALVFSLTQLRTAIYPQLERNGWTMPQATQTARMETKTDTSKSLRKTKRISPEPEAPSDKWSRLDQEVDSIVKSTYLTLPEPIAITQTGPGIPDWRWNTVGIRYGLDTGDNPLVFWLLSPAFNSLLSVVRVLLMIVLILFFFNIDLLESLKWRKRLGRIALLLPAFFFLGFHSIAFGAFPPPELLEELGKRILKPHDCYPQCAAISDLDVGISPANESATETPTIDIRFSVSAIIGTAVPLPAGESTWTPVDLLLDGQPQAATLRKNGTLYLLVPEGRHKVHLKGRASGNRQVRFVFPLKPFRVTVSAPNWRVSGLDDRHHVDTMLQFNREIGEQENQYPLFSDTPNQMADFLRIKRELFLGLEWKVVTSVERFVIAEEQRALSVSLPLLPGELVKTEGLEVKDGRLLLEMPAALNQISWESSIPISSSISMEAPLSAGWSEIWRLQVSPLWHYTAKGLPAAAEEEIPGTAWYPWPGEKLHIELTKLEPVPGQSLTIDSVKADYHIGEGYNRLQLQTRIRTSQGGPHPITPPEGAILKQMKRNGRPLPLSADAKTISLPLQPGSQSVELEWRLPANRQTGWLASIIKPFRVQFPSIDLHADTTNIDLFVHLQPRCWLLLTGGPRLGPAVLMWSLIAAVALIAIILGKFATSPLSTRQWMLLGIGLITLDAITCVLVSAWFIALEARRRYHPAKPWLFNLIQLLLVVWTLIVFVSFFRAVAQGLLGIPDMQIAGNGSDQELLHWTQDRAGRILPRPWVIACSIYLYRAAMFAWSLWLAANLFSWAKWAMEAFRIDGIWKKRNREGRGGPQARSV